MTLQHSQTKILAGAEYTFGDAPSVFVSVTGAAAVVVGSTSAAGAAPGSATGADAASVMLDGGSSAAYWFQAQTARDI